MSPCQHSHLHPRHNTTCTPTCANHRPWPFRKHPAALPLQHADQSLMKPCSRQCAKQDCKSLSRVRTITWGPPHLRETLLALPTQSSLIWTEWLRGFKKKSTSEHVRSFRKSLKIWSMECPLGINGKRALLALKLFVANCRYPWRNLKPPCATSSASFLLSHTSHWYILPRQRLIVLQTSRARIIRSSSSNSCCVAQSSKKRHRAVERLPLDHCPLGYVPLSGHPKIDWDMVWRYAYSLFSSHHVIQSPDSCSIRPSMLPLHMYSLAIARQPAASDLATPKWKEWKRSNV